MGASRRPSIIHAVRTVSSVWSLSVTVWRSLSTAVPARGPGRGCKRPMGASGSARCVCAIRATRRTVFFDPTPHLADLVDDVRVDDPDLKRDKHDGEEHGAQERHVLDRRPHEERDHHEHRGPGTDDVGDQEHECRVRIVLRAAVTARRMHTWGVWGVSGVSGGVATGGLGGVAFTRSR